MSVAAQGGKDILSVYMAPVKRESLAEGESAEWIGVDRGGLEDESKRFCNNV